MLLICNPSGNSSPWSLFLSQRIFAITMVCKLKSHYCNTKHNHTHTPRRIHARSLPTRVHGWGPCLGDLTIDLFYGRLMNFHFLTTPNFNLISPYSLVRSQGLQGCKVLAIVSLVLKTVGKWLCENFWQGSPFFFVEPMENSLKRSTMW